MKLHDIITIIQVLSGAVLLLFSVFLGLKTKKDIPKDLKGKWLAVISFMIFFIVCYILFVFVHVRYGSFLLELVSGSVFLGGACFVYIVIRITRATIRQLIVKDEQLKLDSEQLHKSLDSLKKINKELEGEIARRILSAEALRKSEEKYSSLVESTEDSIYLLDREYRYLFINKKHLSRLGISGSAYTGKEYGDFHMPEVTDRFTKIVDEVFRTGKSVQLEHESQRDNNYFLLTLSPVIESGEKITAVTVVSKKITELKKMEEELRTLTLTDSLTGLYNRRGFLTFAEQHLKIANRMKSKIYMLYADLDDLKRINDAFGHQEGDEALKETARLLEETFRESDILSRIGGDEFVVMPIKFGDENVAAITSRLENNLTRYNEKNHRTYALSISVGITYYDPDQPITVEELLSRCDKLMYKEKTGKKNSQQSTPETKIPKKAVNHRDHRKKTSESGDNRLPFPE
jgi:diguanylate cyclase (GGDEF)-like protein/PAS domain S-box-containing protein